MSAGLMEIEITHYVSPYEIFFKYLPSPDDKIKSMEQAIEAYLRRKKQHNETVFKTGELVFVNYLPYQHGIRGIVLETLYKFSTMQPDYIVWCLDYGFPFRTSGNLVQLLPKDFRNTIEGLCFEHVGLSSIIPLNRSDALDWNYEACLKVIDVLSQGQKIFMMRRREFFNNSGKKTIWCTLLLKNSNGDVWDVGELLDALKIGNNVNEGQFITLMAKKNFAHTAQVWTFCNGVKNYRVNEQKKSDVTQLPLEYNKSTDESQNYSTSPKLSKSSASKESVEDLMSGQVKALTIGNEKSKIDFCFAQPSQLHNDGNYNFQQKIKDILDLMDINEPNILQSYSWPHLQNDNGLFVVSPHGTGKNLCYIPQLLEVVIFDNLLCQPGTYGPTAILVSASEPLTNEIAELFGKLLDHLESKTLSNSVHTSQDSDLVWSKPFGIYVTTLKDFFDVIKKKKIDKNRLKTIVINNIDESVAKDLTNFILKYQQEIVGFQFVITANEWCPNFGDLKKIIPKNPLLLMSDFLEAAIYNDCDIIIKTSENTDDKLNYICNYIENRAALDEVQSIVIVCNKNIEAKQVSEALRGLGISIFLYTEENDLDATPKMKTNEILICTDAIIPKIKLSSMQTIIHYSLVTHSWSAFAARFILVCNYSSLVSQMPSSSLDDPNNHKPSKSIIILDKTDPEFLKEFVRFSQKHKLCKKTILKELSKIIENCK